MNESNEILVVGDVMLDAYISGKVERISPEAPVPVLKATKDSYMIGGAGNVANNLASIGAKVSLLGLVGEDENGQKCAKYLNEVGIGDHLLRSSETITTVKTRVISQNQQIVRVDREKILASAPAQLLDRLTDVLESFNGETIILSDYAKGVCDEEICRLIMSKAQQKGWKVFADPKGIDWEKYRGVYLIKPNIREIEDLLNIRLENEDEEIVTAGQKVLEQYGFEHVLITRSSRGMTLIGRDMVRHFPVDQIDIYDVSGAGDTAIAVLAYMIQHGRKLEESIRIANQASRYVVSKPNTYAITTSELNLLV